MHALLLALVTAHCPTAPEIGTTVSGDAATRTLDLEARFERGAYLSRAWAVGWGVSLGLLAVGQVVIAPFTPREERPDWWVGAGASTIGALTRTVFVPRVLKEQRRLKKDTSSGCERVAKLEAALVRSARWERQGRGWLMHGLTLGFNVGVGLVLGLAFKRPISANRLASMGNVIGEVMIITQPRFMSRTLDGYRRGTLSARPFIAPGGGGLALSGRI